MNLKTLTRASVLFAALFLSSGRDSFLIAGQIFERYTGVFYLDIRQAKQYAKLDFVSLRNEQNRLRIIAIFTIYFGEFGSDEYISYHYDDVEFNLVTGTLTFSKDDQDITIQSTEFNRNRITAVVRSGAAGRIGHIEVFKQQHAPEKIAVLPSLEGRYLGQCSSRPHTINLQTYRSTSDTIRIGNPFGAYQIKGQFARPNELMCHSDKPCVINQIIAGSYNFFSGKMTLQGRQRSHRCHVETNGDITCEGCRYKKQEIDSVPIERDNAKALPRFPNQAKHGLRYLKEGSYRGYLFHEHRRIYQHMAFDVLSYRKSRESKFVLSAVANLYFGENRSNEILTYRFEDLAVNILNDEFVLERTESDVDAILKITQVANDRIKGEWYSILFGRVGDFYAVREGGDRLDLARPSLGSVSGKFKSSRLGLNLDVLLGQTPVNTENPFYPLILTGYFAYQKPIASRLMVTGGSYDFYTGKIGLELAGGDRVIVGHKLENRMELRWTSNGFGTIMQDFSLHSYFRGGA